MNQPIKKQRKCQYCGVVLVDRNNLVLHWQLHCIEGPFIGSNVIREEQLNFADFYTIRIKGLENICARRSERLLSAFYGRDRQTNPCDPIEAKKYFYFLNVLIPNWKVLRDQWRH